MLGAGYILAAIIGTAFGIGNDARDYAIGAALLAGGGLLVLLGLWLLDRAPWPGGILMAIGAMVGGFALFWTVLVPIAAAALAALALSDARGRSSAAA